LELDRCGRDRKRQVGDDRGHSLLRKS
jgi:hypothetical protein